MVTPTREEIPVIPDAPHSRIVITVASMGFFLITLDISIVNVALTRIRAELGGDITGQQWIIDGYTLLFAALLLFAGNLSDRIGAKRALAIGIAIFTVTSAACALAPSTALLIAARAAQGAGAAIMLPASMALVREAFPDPGRRARALGIWAVGGAVAGLVGQPLGGLLTTYDWRWVFTINLPVCAAMLIFLVWSPHRRSGRNRSTGSDRCWPSWGWPPWCTDSSTADTPASARDRSYWLWRWRSSRWSVSSSYSPASATR